jgi:flagellar biosynthesis component FlhA
VGKVGGCALHYGARVAPTTERRKVMMTYLVVAWGFVQKRAAAFFALVGAIMSALYYRERFKSEEREKEAANNARQAQDDARAALESEQAQSQEDLAHVLEKIDHDDFDGMDNHF